MITIINEILPRMIDLKPVQNEKFMEEMILLILKEQKVSLSQARGIFNAILNKIEDNNLVQHPVSF